jgi:hypothetical protein
MLAMFRLDYLSCLLTVVATVLVGRRMWSGLLVSCVNSLIVCVIGLHTSQYGFIPANLFCICINAFNLRAWLKMRDDLSESRTEAGGEPLARARRGMSPAEGMGIVSFTDRAFGVVTGRIPWSGLRNAALQGR